MKQTLLTLTMLLLTSSLFAQIPAVNNASFLQWDHSGDAEYYVYIAETPNIVPDGNPTAQVADLSWTIQGLTAGLKYAVVTAYYNDTTPPTETGPSNEVVFRVLEAPTNLRISDGFLGVGDFDLTKQKLAFYQSGFLAETEAEWIARIMETD